MQYQVGHYLALHRKYELYFQEKVEVTMVEAYMIFFNRKKYLKHIIYISGAHIVIPSLYVNHLDNWLRHFPPEQILVLDGTTLKSQPWKIMEDAERFLGVKHQGLFGT